MFVGYINLKIPNDLHKKLKEIALREEKKLKNVILEALEYYVENKSGR